MTDEDKRRLRGLAEAWHDDADRAKAKAQKAAAMHASCSYGEHAATAEVYRKVADELLREVTRD